MKFSEFYKDAQRELTSTFVSMYAKGRPEYANHLRWLFETEEKEKLVQEPVFQSIFPWEPYSQKMSELTDLLGDDYIAALDTAKFKEPLDEKSKPEDMSFGKDIYPYKHQVESWKAVLEEKKSILVTTGTGSGKTECFMVPVLKELLDIKKEYNGVNPGVQAIFLYPLNALIASQRKRIHAWCDAISPKVTYGIYTGETEPETNQSKRNKSFPQVIDRKTLRENPPQILFTNPTMLEYMMVRSDDQPLVQQSNNLKWIILDEAHTYNGSSAAELAILIRRVLQLFGKKPSDVNFAITSATIGEGKEEEMRKFISNLTGKDAKNDFHFVSGRRIIPTLDDEGSLPLINKRFNLKITLDDIVSLRTRLNNVPALSLREICDELGYKGTTEECLELVDALSVSGSVTSNSKESALLPVRAHFFGRSVNGLYACTNPECTQYRKNHIDIGTLTTIASQTCPHCKGKMLEVVRCGSCGEFLLQGERIIERSQDADPMVSKYSMKDNTIHFQHLLNDDDDSDDENEEDNQILDSTSKLLLSVDKSDVPFEGAELYHHKLDSINGFISEGSEYSSCNNPEKAANELLCPECGDKGFKARKVVLPSSLESRLLAHTFLKQSPANTKANPNEIVYEGRKYITFTDNRQGTANITQGTNISVEREWMRSRVLYDLLNNSASGVDIPTVLQKIAALESALQAASDQIVVSALKDALQNEKGKLDAKTLSSWDEFKNNTLGAQDLKRMREQLGKKEIKPELYLQAMFVDQMGNKPLRSNSLETLGLVHLEYPAIDKLGINDVPGIFVRFYNYTDRQEALKDWKTFLRICLDYQVRRNMHLDFPDDSDLKRLVTQSYFSDPVYSPLMHTVERENGTKCKRWPQIRKFIRVQDAVIGRLPLLLLLGKGICNREDLNDDIADSVNGILDQAWRFLTDKVLKNVDEDLLDNGKTYRGYKLNIFDGSKVKLSLIEKATVCPMTNQILDCSFRGISPMVKGHLDPRTLQKYKITAPEVDVPKFNLKESDYVLADGSVDNERWATDVNNWFDSVFAPAMMPIGGDLSSQRQLFLKRPIFITVEHSGQISSDKLRQSERLFENGKVNVLSCSTTMEMGVDIGGISAVLMNNVPPKPANYLQRTGRAGRRAETQSLALTICNDNPVGREALNNPKWALDHEIESPSVTFSSVTIMQRHVNSLLLGEYIRSTSGGTVADEIGAFIYGTNYDRDKTINYTVNGFMDFLVNARNNVNLAEKIRVITRGTVYETETIDRMISQSSSLIETICTELKGTIDSLEEEKSQATSVKNQRRLAYRIESLWTQNLISYLSGNNFLPSNSIPTNIVDLVVASDKKNKNEDQTIKTQRQLSLAIQEYAPGREVVVDNLVYPVLGIEKRGKVAANQMLEKNISKCPSCGYVSMGYVDVTVCPKCGGNLKPIFDGQRKTATLSVEPCGFVAGDYRRTKKPKLATDFTVPELLGMEPWNEDENETIYRIRASVHADAQILYVNKGKGYGFAFCEYCGKMVPEDGLEDMLTPLPTAMLAHSDISKGGNCYGNTIAGSVKRNVLLSACYHTDITEMDIKSPYNVSSREHLSLLYTLGTIISSTFTQSLGVNADEVWFGITPKNTLFFYDTASGGAGYASQLPIYIEKVLDKCLAKLTSCNCETACTSCLIDRKSQWYIEYLNKKLAIEWLNNEHDSRQEIPSELAALTGSPEIRKITRDITSEISGRLRREDYTNVEYFLAEGLGADDLLEKIESDLLMVNLQTAPVTMVVSHSDAIKKNLPMGIRMSLNSFANRFSNLRAVKSIENGFTPIASFVTNANREVYIQYNSCVYSVLNPTKLSLMDYEVVLAVEPTDVCFVNNFVDEKVLSSKLLSTILGNKSGKLLDFLTDKRKEVYVSYTDIYISNPIGCLILAQVLGQFTSEYGLVIKEVSIYTGHQFKTCADYRRQNYLDTDFTMSVERDEYLQDYIINNVGDVNVDIDSEKKLPHARLLKLYNQDFEITINPDGGFAQGWKAFREYTNTVQNDRRKSIELTNTLYRNSLPIRFTVGWCKK